MTPMKPSTLQRPRAVPAHADNPLLAVILSALVVALLVSGGWAIVQRDMVVPLALPILSMLAVASVIGLILTWRVKTGWSQTIVCTALIFIDLGFNALTPVVLGLKLLGYVLAFILGLRALMARGRAPLGVPTWIFIAYATFACLGVVYSIDRFGTAYTSFALLAIAFLAIWFDQLGLDDIHVVLRKLATGLGVAMIASFLFYLAVPSLAVAQNIAGEGRVGALFGSPNTAGGVAATTVLLNLWRYVDLEERLRGRTALKIVFILAGLAMLALSGSRTALLSMLAAMLPLFIFNLPRLAILAIVVLVTVFTVVQIFGLSDAIGRMLVHVLSRTRSGSDVSSFTGRTEIWHVVITEWKRSPWIGYGLAGGRTLIAEGWSTMSGKTTGTAHNAILESLLAVGIVGTSIVLASAAAAARLLWIAIKAGARARKLAELLVVLLLFVFVFGLTEKSFGGTPSMSTGILGLVIGMSAAVARAVRGAVPAPSIRSNRRVF